MSDRTGAGSPHRRSGSGFQCGTRRRGALKVTWARARLVVACDTMQEKSHIRRLGVSFQFPSAARGVLSAGSCSKTLFPNCDPLNVEPLAAAGTGPRREALLTALLPRASNLTVATPTTPTATALRNAMKWPRAWCGAVASTDVGTRRAEMQP